MVAVERIQDYAHIPKEVTVGRWDEGQWSRVMPIPSFPTKQHPWELESQPG